jgi:hypothetical protein
MSYTHLTVDVLNGFCHKTWTSFIHLIKLTVRLYGFIQLVAVLVKSVDVLIKKIFIPF